MTGTGFCLYFVVIRRVAAMRISLVPLFFAVVLGERLPFEAFIGLALILAGAFDVSSRARAKPPLSVHSPQPRS